MKNENRSLKKSLLGAFIGTVAGWMTGWYTESAFLVPLGALLGGVISYHAKDLVHAWQKSCETVKTTMEGFKEKREPDYGQSLDDLKNLSKLITGCILLLPLAFVSLKIFFMLENLLTLDPLLVFTTILLLFSAGAAISLIEFFSEKKEKTRRNPYGKNNQMYTWYRDMELVSAGIGGKLHVFWSLLKYECWHATAVWLFIAGNVISALVIGGSYVLLILLPLCIPVLFLRAFLHITVRGKHWPGTTTAIITATVSYLYFSPLISNDATAWFVAILSGFVASVMQFGLCHLLAKLVLAHKKWTKFALRPVYKTALPIWNRWEKAWLV